MLGRAPIHFVSRATPRSVLLRLAMDPTPEFLAGQAVLVGRSGGGIRRPYSIAVGPHEAFETHTLELLVGIGADGTPGSHLPSLEPGTLVDVEGPLGNFVYREQHGAGTVLFVAGGSGIAPLRAMLHEALDTPADARSSAEGRRLCMLYSARSPEEFAFDAELAALAGRGAILYRKTATRDAGAHWQGDRGRINRAQLEALVEQPEHTLCFVCGPAALVHEVPRMLEEIGVARDRIRVEEWALPRTS